MEGSRYVWFGKKEAKEGHASSFQLFERRPVETHCFPLTTKGRTHGNGSKLPQNKCRTNLRENFQTVRAVE